MRLRSATRIARGKEWAYLVCSNAEGRTVRLDTEGNLIECHARAVPGPAAEQAVLDAVSRLALPAEVIEAARDELKRRLRQPMPGAADKERTRLTARLERLTDLYSWGHLDGTGYRRQRAEAEAQLAALPGMDQKLVTFDAFRALVTTFPEAIARANREQLQALLAKLVERVQTADQKVVGVTWVPAARPFFAADGAVRVAPPDGLEPPTQALGRLRSIH